MARSLPELHENAIVAFASDLVAIASENPPGAAYDECLARIGAELEALEIDYELVETGDDRLRRQAILAVVGEHGPLLYLHGHYDVVPAFHRDQFVPRLLDGRLIGRGASDMKGGLAAIVYAARDAAEAGARVGLVIVPDEETGGRRGAERLAELGRLDPTAVGAIVAEPTWGTIWHACRGAFTLRVTARGEAAHAGLHYEGRNAFAAAVDVVIALRELEAELHERKSTLTFATTDPRAAESIMLVGGVSGGGTNFNIVPDSFSFTIDRRPNPDEDYEQAKAELLGLLEAARQRGADIEWEVLQGELRAQRRARQRRRSRLRLRRSPFLVFLCSEGYTRPRRVVVGGSVPVRLYASLASAIETNQAKISKSSRIRASCSASRRRHTMRPSASSRT